MTPTDPTASAHDALPRWSVTDVHESLDSRSFTDALERLGAEVDRLITHFDELGIGATEPRRPTSSDGEATEAAIDGYNRVAGELRDLYGYVYSTVSTDSRHEQAQALLSEIGVASARLSPLVGRLAEWVDALGVEALGEVSDQAKEHRGPLDRLAQRVDHQMSEAEENLYADLATTGSGAWGRLQRDVTSQLTTTVDLPNRSESLPMPAVRGLATHGDPAVRQAAYEAEMDAWPTVALPVAAAMNAIKGEANSVNRRRRWESPLDAALYANSVSPATFGAMQSAVTDALPDLRRWMRSKAALHGYGTVSGLKWWDLVAPAPVASAGRTWDDGIELVRNAFAGFGGQLGSLVDRALDEQWIDAATRDGKTGGAFCMPFVGDRSLVLLNWSGSAESTQTTAHELGHAYHNTTLAGRTPLQRRLPMALAETASIFCETLVVQDGLDRLDGDERLALLDVDLQGTNQVIVDIHSRFLFETEVFARRRRRTLSVSELCQMMTGAQETAYGDGLDQTTAHPWMWLLKPHYYGSHFYNWPYTYGLLFGLMLHSEYVNDPERFRAGYDDLLSRAGIDTAEQLAAGFGLDVTEEATWQGALDVVRARIDEYVDLVAEHT